MPNQKPLILLSCSGLANCHFPITGLFFSKMEILEEMEFFKKMEKRSKLLTTSLLE
jgi:hypothetical protein